MDNSGCQNKALRKVKKKKEKDEMDRLKQAEKKKRRLEKALATSAAIRSELEKKKQKKKEEQERLDEEGAAIAEAVALQVLVGEDYEDSLKYKVVVPWNHSVLMNGRHPSFYQSYPKCSIEGIGWMSGGYGGDDWLCSHGSDLQRLQHFHGRGWSSTQLASPGLVAAEAVSSLQIREDAVFLGS